MDRVSGGPAAATELLHEPDTEYRGATPVWRVSYDDEDSARVYISPITGEVIGTTNSMWRLHDFVWMLHIMDYDERRDYNNWILRAVAIMGGLFALTGVACSRAQFVVVAWRCPAVAALARTSKIPQHS